MTTSESCSRRVLVVEDDTDIRQAVMEVLEDNAYQPVAASNGVEALQLLRERSKPDPCLILLDVMMPVMDGWQFRAEQRRDPTLEGIPVVLITAHAQMTEPPMDAVAVLKKPFEMEALLDLVERFCGAPH